MENAPIARPLRQVRNRAFRYASKNYLNLFSFAMLLCALFYFVQIQQLRSATLSNNPELFSDGDIVTVVNVIDGDEVRIKNSKGSSRLRILGIMSFDPNDNSDLMLAEMGRFAVEHLEQEYVGKELRLIISEKRVDNEGRLLGSLILDEGNLDIAKSMVSQGLTLVYTKFSFPAMDEYLDAQDSAKIQQQGFWQSRRVTDHAESMLNLWEQERRNR